MFKTDDYKKMENVMIPTPAGEFDLKKLLSGNSSITFVDNGVKYIGNWSVESGVLKFTYTEVVE